jgi:hypothetical protein
MIKRIDIPAMMASLDESARHNVLNSRRSAIDPGDVNTLAAVELGRALMSEGKPESDKHRPQIKTHLSKKNYERRTRWEVRRRRDNQEYREAMNILARAGTTWKTTDPDQLDAMIRVKARAWSAALGRPEELQPQRSAGRVHRPAHRGKEDPGIGRRPPNEN